VQTVRWIKDTMLLSFSLPDPDEQVLPGATWGKADELFSSAYWAAIARMTPNYNELRFGRTLREEVAACLLGGYGIPAEIGIAAFVRLRSIGLLSSGTASEDRILEALAAPLMAQSGKLVRYRFARQKAKYLAQTLRVLEEMCPPQDSGRLLRDWLRDLPGIGWKTASWIARNWIGSEDVAILDIHIMRAGFFAGVFEKPSWCNREYPYLEARFLAWAGALNVPPTHLDALIWKEMRSCPRLTAAKWSDLPRVRYPHRQRHREHPRPVGAPTARRSGRGSGKKDLVLPQ
jgi:N-glycosylase/DNA lyase